MSLQIISDPIVGENAILRQVGNQRFTKKGYYPLFKSREACLSFASGETLPVAITIDGIVYYNPGTGYWIESGFKGIYNSLKLPVSLTDLDPSTWIASAYRQGDLIKLTEEMPADIKNKKCERIHDHTFLPNVEFERIILPEDGNCQWQYYFNQALLPFKDESGPSEKFYVTHLFRSKSNPQIFVYHYPHGDHEEQDTVYPVSDSNGLQIGYWKQRVCVLFFNSTYTELQVSEELTLLDTTSETDTTAWSLPSDYTLDSTTSDDRPYLVIREKLSASGSSKIYSVADL